MKDTDLKKGSKDYLIDRCDEVINDLVHDKTSLYKAYNYYHGFRDTYLYANFEKTMLIASPTHISFTPLVRKHIDAIVGEYLANDLTPKISCKDTSTITNILRDKQLALLKANHDYVRHLLDSSIYSSLMGGDGNLLQLKLLDPIITKELQEIEENINRSFISNYEIAAQTIILYVLNSRNLDCKNKLADLLKDLLIAGLAYYRINPTSGKTNFEIEILDPINTFVEKNPNSQYFKNSYRACHRKYMSKQEIIIKYGEDLSKDDIKSLDEILTDDLNDTSTYVAINNRGCYNGMTKQTGLINNDGTSFNPYFKNNLWDLIPVYETEWIDYDKENGNIIGKRYDVVRIGLDIYILHGEDKRALRDVDAPAETRLRINGMFYTDRTGVPYSLILATADQQDLYDLMLYKRDSLVATSGIKGSIIDLAHLPEVLGDSLEERIMKFLSYKKAGLALYDSSQEGDVINTIFNGFDDSISGPGLLSIVMVIQQIEDTVSSITGVFKERIGGIAQRDAVTNVKIGMQQSYIITGQYNQMMDTLLSELLLDCLDMAKIVYKYGFSGQMIVGGNVLIFNLVPEYYTTTSFDVHVVTNSEIVKEKTFLQLLATSFAQQNNVDPDMIIAASTAKSVTEMKDTLLKSIAKRKAENDQLKQALQQIEELTKQNKEMQKQLEASTKKISQLDEKRLAFEQQTETNKQKIDWFKVQQDAEFKNKELELIKERTRLEAVLLYDNNPYNDKIANKKR